MLHLSRARLGLFVLLAASALFLTACVDTTPSWPGLAANGQLAFVAFGQQVHAVDLSNGKPVWDFPPEKGDGNIGAFYAPPALANDLIIVASEGPAGSHSGMLFGLNPTKAAGIGQWQWCLVFDSKGNKRQRSRQWNCQLAPDAEDDGLFGFAAPSDNLDNRLIGGLAIAGDTAYFGMASGRVYAVNIATGAVVAHYDDISQPVWAAPLVRDDTVYVTSLDHALYALNRTDLSLKWKQDLGASMAGTPALFEDTLYVGTFDNKLHALDAETGDEKWSFDANNWVWSSPVVQDGVLYFADLSGTVFALDAQTKAQQWAVTPGGVIRGSPAVISDTLFVGDRDGRLIALNRSDGSTRWSQPQNPQGKPGQLLASPLAVGDLVLVTPYQGDNLLVAYTAAGDFKWAFAPSK